MSTSIILHSSRAILINTIITVPYTIATDECKEKFTTFTLDVPRQEAVQCLVLSRLFFSAIAQGHIHAPIRERSSVHGFALRSKKHDYFPVSLTCNTVETLSDYYVFMALSFLFKRCTLSIEIYE